MSHNLKYYLKSLKRNSVKSGDIRNLWKKKKENDVDNENSSDDVNIEENVCTEENIVDIADQPTTSKVIKEANTSSNITVSTSSGNVTIPREVIIYLFLLKLFF